MRSYTDLSSTVTPETRDSQMFTRMRTTSQRMTSLNHQCWLLFSMDLVAAAIQAEESGKIELPCLMTWPRLIMSYI